MFKFVASLLILAVASVTAQYYVAPLAPAAYARYATPYIATYPRAPLAIAQPYVAKLALPAATAYSQYSSVATPNSYSQQYQSEQKPLPYSAIYY